MNTFNNSYNNSPAANYKCNLSFKVTWETHSQIQEIATEAGQNITITCRDLIELGLANYNRRHVNDEDKPKIKVIEAAKRVRELHHWIQVLADIKDEISIEEFQNYCHSLGIDPAEVEDVAPLHGKITKRDRCCSFLRVLFTDRPEGLPATRVLEISAREGFGQNLVYESATEIGIRFQPTDTNEGRIYIWISPETL